jgi:flagellar hook-length control protein FliK
VHTPIVTAVLPLVQRGDGSYHVAVRLHPEELGAVDVDVELRGGEINLRLRTETVAGRDAIRLALPMLRSELEAAGVQTGTFDLGDQPSGQLPQQQQQGSGSSSPAFTTAALDEVPVPDTDPEADPAALDVRV